MKDIIKEDLTYSNYEVRQTQPSLIDISATVTSTTGFKCPCCSRVHKDLDHAAKMECSGCGLKMQRFGNCLRCESRIK